MSRALDTLLAAAASRAELEARTSGLRVVAKTSITPALTVYDAQNTAPGLLEAIGIRTHIVAVTDSGVVVAELGEPAPTDWPLAVAIYATLAVLGFLVIAIGARVLR